MTSDQVKSLFKSVLCLVVGELFLFLLYLFLFWIPNWRWWFFVILCCIQSLQLFDVISSRNELFSYLVPRSGPLDPRLRKSKLIKSCFRLAFCAIVVVRYSHPVMFSFPQYYDMQRPSLISLIISMVISIVLRFSTKKLSAREKKKGSITLSITILVLYIIFATDLVSQYVAV
jgi:hypothetical protein